MTRAKARPLVGALLVVAVVVAACSNDSQSKRSAGTDGAGPTTTSPPRRPKPPAIPAGTMSIEVLSSQPDRVTGGDARISVTPPEGTSPTAIRVSVGTRDVTSRLQPSGTKLEGTVSGFVEGTSTITATAGSRSVQRRIRDYPLTGPVLSGPHLPLLVCTTEKFGLGKATDRDCSAPTKVTYRYVSTDGTMKDLPDPAARPADLATSTINGRAVPLIVREERGVINRSVYFIATIDPTPGGVDIDHRDAAWNGRLIYRFGGGCGISYSQGVPLTTVDEPKLLAKGYAVATATFNTFQVQCNDVLSAETVMMVKERFIEEFGVPTHTIGEGASGGSIQEHLIVQNYPGLLDGAVAILPFPDAITIAPGVADCGLLDRFYRSPEGSGLTPLQRAAVNGHAVPGTCELWERSFLVRHRSRPPGATRPSRRSQIYDARTRRNGLRCTLQDGNINQFGRDPEDRLRPPAARQRRRPVRPRCTERRHHLGRPVPGHQRGHRRLRHRRPTPASTGRGRPRGAAGGLRDRTGVVGRWRPAAGADHRRQHLHRPAGRHPRPVPRLLLARPAHRRQRAVAPPRGGTGPADLDPIAARWWDADQRPRQHHHRGRPRPRGDRRGGLLVGPDLGRPRRGRPPGEADPHPAAEATDNCVDSAGERLSAVDLYTKPGPCTTPYPLHGDPRTAAGAPRANDILKCQLRAVDARSYRVPFTEPQLTRLRRIFPSGVCDWTRRGVGQGPPLVPNRVYDDRNDPVARS